MSIAHKLTKLGKIDFKGQKLAERVGVSFLVSFAILSLAVGKVTDDLMNTIYVYLAGVIIALLVVALPLPMYKKHPVQWLDQRKSKADTKKTS
ncbi:hypothetical protein BB560_000881 [Smittium megazygosporum]|uniref:Signal peptidase complex subunit 1 n=1 Tax=Smittium megazygosporum TaxID=133381 RepID=A0A2T9ZJC1_9FUNG|nr:hypothetical protein BB560_000881 [Smittium megazygosporum]